MKKLAIRQDRLVDPFVHEGKIDKATFEQQRSRLERERDDLLDRLHAGTSTREVDLEGALAFAELLLDDLPGCWNRLKQQERPSFLKAICPAGMTYRDGSIGTAETSWLFPVFGNHESSEEGWVAPTGFEPVLPP